MPTICPAPSSLPTFCVGGQLSPGACDNLVSQDIRVQLRLVDQAGNPVDVVTDPTSCGEIVSSVVEEIHENTSGCWCVCLPFANYSSVDGNRAPIPATTAWQIQLFVGDATLGNWQPVGQQRRFSIDADFDYAEACGDCGPYTVSCGDCIPIVCLLETDGNPAVVPSTPNALFCDAVMGCMQETVNDLQVQINNIPTSFTYVPWDPATHVNGTIVGAGSPADPFQVPLPFDQEQFFTYVVYDAAVHSTGTPVGSGTNADPYQIPLPQTICDMLAGVQTVNGVAPVGTQFLGSDCTFYDLPAESVYQYVDFNSVTHASGTIAGSGTTADPFQIPLPPTPPDGGEIENVELVSTTTDPALNTVTQLFRITETDDGDADPATHDFSVVIPVPQAASFAYAPYDAATHGAGAITGTGTAADPYQIPLSPDVCSQLGGLPAATGATLETDEVLVIQADGSCARKTIAPSVLSYSPYDPATHQAGTVVGSGTTADPSQIPLPPVYTYVPYDAATHDAGAVAGAGTAASPYEIPLPPTPETQVEVTGISITGNVTNPDGSTTVTYTLTETDDGDADPASHSFDVVFPAAASNADLCDLIAALTAATGTVLASDEVVVIQADGSCARKTLPTSGGSVTVGLSDDDTSTINLVDTTSGSVISAIPLCDLIDDLTVSGTFSVNGVNVFYDPVTESCGLQPQAAYQYTNFDAATHTAATGLAGAGTTADPYQVALPLVTSVYKEGSTIAYDVDYVDLNGDAQTLTAGDPVPDGITFINDENPDGSLVTSESLTDCCGCSTCLEVPVAAAPITVSNADLNTICAGSVTPATSFELIPVGNGQNVPATVLYAGEANEDPTAISSKLVSLIPANQPVNTQVTPSQAVAVGDVVVFTLMQGQVDDTDQTVQTLNRDPSFVNNGTATVGPFTQALYETFGFSTGDELDPGFGDWHEHSIWWAPVTAAGNVQLDATLPDRPSADYGDIWAWNLYVAQGVDPANPFVQSYIEPMDVISGNLVDYSVADFDGMLDVNGSRPIPATLPTAAANPVLVSFAAHRAWDVSNPNDPRNPNLPLNAVNAGAFSTGNNWGGFDVEGTDGTTIFQNVVGSVAHSDAALMSGLLGNGALTDTGAPSTSTATMWARFNVGAPKGNSAASQDRHSFDTVSIMMLEFNVMESAGSSCTPGVTPPGTSIQSQSFDVPLPCGRPRADTMEIALNVPRIEMVAAPGSAYEVQFFVNGELAAAEGIDNSLGGTVAMRNVTSIGHTLLCESSGTVTVDVQVACCAHTDAECNLITIDGGTVVCSLTSL